MKPFEDQRCPGVCLGARIARAALAASVLTKPTRFEASLSKLDCLSSALALERFYGQSPFDYGQESA